MDLPKFLTSFGLTESEGKAYLAALKQTRISASELSKMTEIKRPALYHALETLEKKGLVSISKTGRVLQFRAEPPERLKSLLHRKAMEVESLKKKLDKNLPFFPTVEEVPAGEARVEFFRGTSGIKNLAEKSFENKEKKLFAIVPSFAVFLEAFTKEYAAYYVEEKLRRGIVTKSIWAAPLKNESEFKKQVTDHAAFLREVRYAPKEMAEKAKSIILIWDDSVAIINSTKEPFGVLIVSADYSETMRAMWAVAWKAGKKAK